MVVASHRPRYRGGGNLDLTHVPGFIRVEPGEGGGNQGIGEEWYEWEVTLSR